MKRVAKNGIYSVLQKLFSGVILFFTYRFLLQEIGAELFGLWTLLSSFSYILKVSNLGLSGGVVKYVASYRVSGKVLQIPNLLFTTLLSILVIVSIVILLLYPLALYLLPHVLEKRELLMVAKDILVFVLISFLFNNLGSVFLGALDGFQRIDIRTIVVNISNLIFLISCFYFVPDAGIYGLAYSYLIQAVFTFVGGTVMATRFLSLKVFALRWDKAIFKDIWRYGLNFQAISLFQMLTDPIVKFLMSYFGSLELTAFYEMASKYVFQLRQLLISANQAALPVLAEASEQGSTKLAIMFSKMFTVTFFLATIYFAAIASFAPFVSQVWIGDYNEYFITYTYLLSLSWFFNTIDSPAFFTNLGTGMLGINIRGSGINTILVIVLGMVLGNSFGALGVVCATMIATITGALYTMIMSIKKYNITDIARGSINYLLFFISLTVAISWFLVYSFTEFQATSIILQGLILAVSIGLFCCLAFFNSSEKNVIYQLIAKKKAKGAT